MPERDVSEDAMMQPAYVIKPSQFPALNYLAPSHPRPVQVEWINRATDQKLRPTTVDLLLRTLASEQLSPSVARLQETAGLKAIFKSDQDRDRFALAVGQASNIEAAERQFHIMAVFNDPASAEQVVVQLQAAGVGKEAVSLLWKASQFLDSGVKWRQGHSKLSVAGVVAGGSIAAAILGVALLAIPGIGPLVAAGAAASSAQASVAAVSAAIGAAGGGIAKMLTDYDVDDVSESYYIQQIRNGRVFLSVDMRSTDVPSEIIRQIINSNNGK